MKYIKKQNIIIIIVILLLLLISNKLIVTVFDLGTKEERLNENKIYSSNKIKIDIDRVEMKNTFTNTYSINGWSFVKNRPELELNQMYLKSNKTYAIKNTIYNRGDIVRRYIKQYSANEKCGFVSDFSIVGVDDDKYELVLKYIDSENNVYLYGTKKCYRKKNKKLYKVLCDDIVSINNVTLKNTKNIALDFTIKKDGYVFQISGWAYLKDKMKSGTVYVGIKDKTGKEMYYQAEQLERQDVVTHFNNKNLLNSGFQADIELSNNEEYTFTSIIIEYSGEYYKQEIVGKQQSGDENTKEASSSLINIDKTYIVNGDNILMNVENINDEAIFNISGWAYLKDINKTGKVYVGIKGKAGKELYYTTEQIKRVDVVEHFNNNADLLNSGFKANIKLENVEDYQLSSIVIEYDGKYYRQEIGKKKDKEKNIKEETYSSIFNIDKKEMVNGDHVLMNVERIDDEKTLNISGWAYIKDIKKTGSIYVGVKDEAGEEKFYIAEQEKRDDVVRHFNNADLLYSGFKANIKLEKNEKLTFSSIVIKDDNKYYKQNIDKNPVIKLEKEKIIESNHLDLYVEKNEQQNNALFIAGWAYIKNIKKIGPIYIGVKDKAGKETYYITEQIERPDVVKYFNNADLLKSGFQVKIENNEAFKLSSVIVEYENKYYKTNIE